MVSLQRRQVLIGGLTATIAPAFSWAVETPENQGKLVLSGRVVDRDGRPVRGATLTVSQHEVLTDADGRFVLATQRGPARFADAWRDADGTWRASVALTV